jgi:hypothetical protein
MSERKLFVSETMSEGQLPFLRNSSAFGLMRNQDRVAIAEDHEPVIRDRFVQLFVNGLKLTKSRRGPTWSRALVFTQLGHANEIARAYWPYTRCFAERS